ncbi:G4 quadruplex nucleic acid binding protein [Savitreella phatthalungensis]
MSELDVVRKVLAAHAGLSGSVDALSLDDLPGGPNTGATVLGQRVGKVGSSNIEKAEVQQWLTLSANVNDALLLDLNTHLARQTFLVGEDWTVADLVCIARLHDTVKKWDNRARSQYCHITRWFDHAQHISGNTLPIVEIDPSARDTSVTPVIRAGAPKEAVPANTTRGHPGTPADTPTSKQPQKQGKQAVPDKANAAADKKAAKAAKAAEASAAASAAISPARVSFKVGVISKCELHPDADSLYVSTVDLGEPAPRTVVSGLVKYIPLAEMQGRRIVAVCNLKPAAMRGVKSSAMVLAASPADLAEGQTKEYLELVQPPEGSKPGDVLTFEGYADTQPDEQLNPKKKVFEAVQPNFTTSQDLQVIYKDGGGKLVDGKGQACTVKSLVGASIR